ncbi:MAG TPA: UBP-type zinc finger domain-containing protein [Micromonosporaceae bacterium]|nr:UBP-type zinc finger domain-containing protein [Micromonosporaceae bacterium]
MICEHLKEAGEPTPQSTDGCQECLAEGRRDWVHLRLCLDCGHVGCCDSSPRRHATAHFQTTGHPVIRSFQPGETWRWCYLDEVIG